MAFHSLARGKGRVPWQSTPNGDATLLVLAWQILQTHPARAGRANGRRCMINDTSSKHTLGRNNRVFLAWGW